MAPYDLVIRGGLVVAGDGGEAYEADVAVKDGVIAAVGANLAAGVEEMDARDRIVTPGFVDIHTHYDGQITWEERLEPVLGPWGDHAWSWATAASASRRRAPATTNS